MEETNYGSTNRTHSNLGITLPIARCPKTTNQFSISTLSELIETTFATGKHDSCLLEGYRNPAKDRLTQTADHYIEAKRQFELAVLRPVIPSSEWNTLDDVITSKIPPDDADKPWIWLQKIKEHYVGASTLMQDRYHF